MSERLDTLQSSPANSTKSEQSDTVEYSSSPKRSSGPDSASSTAPKSDSTTMAGPVLFEQPTIGGMSISNTRRLVLFICVMHNSVHTVLMRYTRVRAVPDMFLPSVAVFYTEIMKLGVCTVLVAREENGWGRAMSAIFRTVIQNPGDTMKVGVLAFLYTMQSNLFYVGASHLEAATFMVTSQLKIFTTAVFAVIMLRKRLSLWQWVALILLFGGVSMVQMPASDPATSAHSANSSLKNQANDPDQSPLLGFFAVLGAATISGFAGIYFELILKDKTAPVSLWMRNVQLATCAIPIGMATALIKDGTVLAKEGWFYGFDFPVWCMVFWYGLGGLVVAVTIKYADNILKNFGTALAIVNSTVASMYIFGFVPSNLFVVGAATTVSSIFLYSSAFAQPRPAHSLLGK